MAVEQSSYAWVSDRLPEVDMVNDEPDILRESTASLKLNW